MRREDYEKKVLGLYHGGQIDEDTYNTMVEVAGELYDDDEDDYYYGLPSSYAEVEYNDFENAEAIDGARFDDINYLRYTER